MSEIINSETEVSFETQALFKGIVKDSTDPNHQQNILDQFPSDIRGKLNIKSPTCDPNYDFSQAIIEQILNDKKLTVGLGKLKKTSDDFLRFIEKMGIDTQDPSMPLKQLAEKYLGVIKYPPPQVALTEGKNPAIAALPEGRRTQLALQEGNPALVNATNPTKSGNEQPAASHTNIQPLNPSAEPKTENKTSGSDGLGDIINVLPDSEEDRLDKAWRDYGEKNWAKSKPLPTEPPASTITQPEIDPIVTPKPVSKTPAAMGVTDPTKSGNEQPAALPEALRTQVALTEGKNPAIAALPEGRRTQLALQEGNPALVNAKNPTTSGDKKSAASPEALPTEQPATVEPETPAQEPTKTPAQAPQSSAEPPASTALPPEKMNLQSQQKPPAPEVQAEKESQEISFRDRLKAMKSDEERNQAVRKELSNIGIELKDVQTNYFRGIEISDSKGFRTTMPTKKNIQYYLLDPKTQRDLLSPITYMGKTREVLKIFYDVAIVQSEGNNAKFEQWFKSLDKNSQSGLLELDVDLSNFSESMIAKTLKPSLFDRARNFFSKKSQ